jgi:hypothetical protein
MKRKRQLDISEKEYKRRTFMFLIPGIIIGIFAFVISLFAAYYQSDKLLAYAVLFGFITLYFMYMGNAFKRLFFSK